MNLQIHLYFSSIYEVAVPAPDERTHKIRCVLQVFVTCASKHDTQFMFLQICKKYVIVETSSFLSDPILRTFAYSRDSLDFAIGFQLGDGFSLLCQGPDIDHRCLHQLRSDILMCVLFMICFQKLSFG